MKKTAIVSILPYLKGARYISTGTTAICFKMKNGKTLKLFIDTYKKQKLFNVFGNMTDHFEKINTIKNDSYMVPEELLIKDGECIAYIYDYISSRTLKYFKLNRKLNELVYAYNKLVEDTMEISDKKFELRDVHSKNILFDCNYKIIDLDKGDFSEDDYDKIYNHNIHTINKVIIHSIFNVPLCKEIEFFNSDLNDLYKQTIYGENNFKKLFKEINKYDDTINTKYDILIKSKKLIKTRLNDYYKDYE